MVDIHPTVRQAGRQAGARSLARGVWHDWHVYCAREWVREAWAGLPGPWWCKALLCAACLAVPGPQDELLLLAVTAACRAWRARRLARA